jgi:translation initiation factor IF-2
MSPTTKQKSRKLFRVASEFNVSTVSIVDLLTDKGFDIANRPTAKITSEMYEVVEGAYGDDKARNREHTRGKYESRRDNLPSGRKKNVSVDDILTPLEAEDEFSLEPQDAEDELESIGGLKPQSPEELEPEPEAEDKEQEQAEVEVQEESSEKEEQQEAQEEQEASETKQPEEEVLGDESEGQAEKEPEEYLAAQKEEEKEQEEEDQIEIEEGQPETAEDETDQEEEETPEESEGEIQEDKRKAEEEKIKKKIKEEGVIRGRAGRLKGTKVVGKVNIDQSKPKRRRKRKRRKDQKNAASAKKKKKSKKKKKKSRKRSSNVKEERVESKLNETLRKMESSNTLGSRRQRRRRQRREERQVEEQELAELEELEEQVIEATEFITVSELAEEMGVRSNEVITTCMNLGMMVSINQRLDASTIELVAEEFGFEVDFVDADSAIEEIALEEDDPEDLEPRAPVITVMGHVDHGKTSLLDYIRKDKVAEGEAGGITQHVGAYEIETDDERQITFIDTPGHEAFTAMRSRGADATDIVVLVVAADDSVMPQTIEAINHSKAAGVPIVVAINKIDKPGANPDKIKQQLAEHDVIVEEYGGDNQSSEVSAKTGEGVDELLEKVLLQAEVMELQANPNRRANGLILESRVDKGKGTIANILIQNGTLKVGDPFVAGSSFGRVRAMENEHGDRMEQAGPSAAAQLMGLQSLPQAGDKIIVTQDEKKAKNLASERQQIRREQDLRRTQHLTLDDLSRRMALGEVSELDIIIKADVGGSIEALSGALQQISTDEVSINIIHTGAGAITQSDVLLASASNGIIIGFQVRPTAEARHVAREEEIDIRLFSVIYDAVDAVKDAMEGMLSPELNEELIGNAEAREIFKISGVGTIAGSYVTEGYILRNEPVRIVRDGVVIYEGEIDSLKRFKEDVNEVQTGYECGISIVGYNDLKEGDIIENYKIVEEQRTLEDAKSFD